MGIYFSKHAKQRLKERGITERKVRKAITGAEDVLCLEKGKYRCSAPISQEKKIVVIFSKKNRHIIIITAYYSI